MRDTFFVFLSVATFLALMVGLASIVSNQQAPKPLETTARLLDCDADFYAGKEIRVATKPFEPGESDSELRFRRQTDHPYVVVLRFKSKMPAKLPEFVTGICQGRINGVVLVIDCR